jgi:hypothetical protein
LGGLFRCSATRASRLRWLGHRRHRVHAAVLTSDLNFSLVRDAEPGHSCHDASDVRLRQSADPCGAPAPGHREER